METATEPLKGLTLYQHEQRLYEAHERLSEALDAGGTAPAEALAVVNEFALAAAEKRDACAAVLRRLDNEDEYISEEIKRLEGLRAVRRNQAGRLRGMILGIMQSHGITKIKGNTTTFSVMQNPPHVEVDAQDLVPMEFQKVETSVTVDKKAVKAAIEAGQEVPGARLVPGEIRLVIR